jgi:ABC-type multidrug transport system fused ATPase/permease subunit
MGKAMAAAERIFGIIESKSEINAVELDNDSTKKRLSINDVQGNIEFKNVWFRYPTRKTDFVLRGLNIKVTAG